MHRARAPAPKSYLNIPAIISAAEITGADAIHPGYGFLSENAEFARICAKCGITFIGPTPEAMRAWGDKVTARENAERFGLPLLPGSRRARGRRRTPSREAKRIGFPVILKACGGGGGRGMRIVRGDGGDARRLRERDAARPRRASRTPTSTCEKFVERPRHIEFQVLADQHGGVWTLGERECSLQRRHQKVIEEAPSPAMTPEKRQEMGEVIRRAVRETGYTSLGTLEFLMDEKRELYFLEMNTRVQVEHPVTEMVTGLDLVALQIRAAAGEKIDLPDTRPWSFRGHAIECRINAEDPKTFAPWPGLITEYHPPGGAGVRVDSGVYGGWRVPADYDSLLAKLIVHAPTRAEAIVRMRRALDEFIVGGHPHEHRPAQGAPRRRRGHRGHDDDADHRASDRRELTPGPSAASRLQFPSQRRLSPVTLAIFCWFIPCVLLVKSPPRVEKNATVRPSGEHVGYVFEPWSCVRRFMLAALPLGSTLKMSQVAPSRPMKRIFAPPGRCTTPEPCCTCRASSRACRRRRSAGCRPGSTRRRAVPPGPNAGCVLSPPLVTFCRPEPSAFPTQMSLCPPVETTSAIFPPPKATPKMSDRRASGRARCCRP